MNQKEYIALASEVNELEAILAQIPADRVIDRMSFETRLQNARDAISCINAENLPKKARLTFRGNPVFGSHGIAAEFACRASTSFTEAFTAIVASITENLRYMGPIPDKQKNQLIITGTAIGSFGFEYELPSENAGSDPAQLEMNYEGVNNAELAMQRMEDLFRVSSDGNDDELSELVDEIHPRAVRKVAEFLSYISDQEAWCGLDFNESIFRFTGSKQVRTSAQRLNADNIRDTTEEFTGRFDGALPTSRTFEFKPVDQRGILRGKIGPDIEDSHVINRDYLGKLVKVSLNVIQVGQGRPRYTLAKLEDIAITH
jgi:hypothetical protein